MTPDKNFRLKKPFKSMIALMGGTDKAARNQLKRMLISAQLSEEAAKRASLKSKDRSKDSE